MRNLKLGDLAVLLGNENLTPENIYNIFQQVSGQLIIPNYTLEAGNYLMRARFVDKIEAINSPRDLSYPPEDLIDKHQRASLPHNSIFYAVCGDSTKNCLSTCFNELKPLNATNENEFLMAVGTWKLLKDIKVAAIINIDKNRSAFFNEGVSGWKMAVEKMCDKDKEGLYSFMRFMSKQFCKNAVSDKDYWFTSVFATLLLNSKRYDGIVYESVASSNPCSDNVHCYALPYFVADNYLALEDADCYKIEFDNGIYRFTNKIRLLV